MKNPQKAESAETAKASMTMTSPWLEYEREKAKLRKLDLDYSEFQRRLSEIAERLGI